MAKPWWRRAHVLVGILFWCAIAAGLAWRHSTPTLDDTAIVSTYGSIDAVRMEKGSLRIKARHRATYRLTSADEDVRKALEDAAGSGKSIAWRLHLGGGWVNPATGRLEYWVDSFDYEGRTFGPWKQRARWSWRSLPEAQGALLRGYALNLGGQVSAALEQLDRALISEALPPRVRALALETRGDVLESMAYDQERELNDADDALLVRALEDYRLAAKLDPDNPRLLMDAGNVSASLGAYDEALALFDSVQRRWPQEAFYATLRRSAIRRQMGDAQAALRALDQLARDGQGRGMMYHYHRGWTLNALGRHADAIDTLTSGLESQPDYPWAFAERGCAHGQLGQVDDAIADLKQAVELHQRRMRAQPDADESADHEALQRRLAALEQARATAPKSRTEAGCRAPTRNPGYVRRELSPLFRKA